MKIQLKPNKEFILHSYTHCRLRLDKLLRRTGWRQVSYKNRGEVLVTHILHSASPPLSSGSFLLLPSGFLEAAQEAENWASFQWQGLFWVTFTHFYTLRAGILLAEQENWLLFCLLTVSLQAGLTFFIWRDIDGVINIFFLIFNPGQSFFHTSSSEMLGNHSL